MLLATPQPAETMPEMYWQRTFLGRPEEARAARNFLRALLPDHSRLQDMLLATDELVVNAMQHTRSGDDGGSFRVEVLLDADHVTISVTDQGGLKEPAHRPADGLAESGRGLALATALAGCLAWSGGGDGCVVSIRFPAA